MIMVKQRQIAILILAALPGKLALCHYIAHARRAVFLDPPRSWQLDSHNVTATIPKSKSHLTCCGVAVATVPVLAAA